MTSSIPLRQRDAEIGYPFVSGHAAHGFSKTAVKSVCVNEVHRWIYLDRDCSGLANATEIYEKKKGDAESAGLTLCSLCEERHKNDQSNELTEGMGEELVAYLQFE